ncbi:MAG: hypothetical protein DMF82_21270 [Acidobacteria bacterium]|nr:MAG: hypothetical protein DMF82_21270 [Acidobacteriota bacterium]
MVVARAHGPQRRGGGAGGEDGGGVPAGQARLRGGAGFPRLLPEPALFGAPRGERGPARFPGDARGRVPAPDGGPDRPARHPHPGQDVKRPLIGITIGYSRQDREIFALRDDYVRSVETAGGLPLVLAPGRPEDATALLDHIDGLLLTGGADVDPGLYGEPPHETVTQVIPERDAAGASRC